MPDSASNAIRVIEAIIRMKERRAGSGMGGSTGGVLNVLEK